MISKLPRAGGGVECPKGVFGSAASEAGHGSRAVERGDDEDGGGEAKEEADE